MQKTKSIGILGGFMLLIIILLNLISKPYTMESITPMDKDVQYYTDKSPILTKLEKATVIKDIGANQKIYFQYNLPEFTSQDYIMVKANHQSISVRLGDTEIFSSIAGTGENPGISWSFVNLDTNIYSQKLTVVLSSPYKNYAGRVPPIFMGSPISLYSYALSSSMYDIVIFMLCLVTAILGIVTHLIWNKSQRETMTLGFSVFLILLGLYLVSGQPIMNLLFSPLTVSNVHLSLASAIPTAILYVGARYFTKYKFVIRITFLAFCVFNVVTIFGSWFNVVHLPAIIPSFTVFLIIACFASFSAIVAEFFKGNKLPAIFAVTVFALGLAIILRLTGSIFSKYVLTCCVIVACLYYMSQLLGSVFSLQRLKRSNQKLQNIAFVDTFTGFRNRNAFEQFMLIMNEEDLSSQKISVVVFDLNNLKKVNDTLGHKAGDDYIIKCTSCMSRHFNSDEEEIFRTGGDEFVVICAGESIGTIKHKLEQMDLEFEGLSVGIEYAIGVAYGVASFDKKRDRTLNDTIRRADKEMYANKLAMKRSFV